MKNLPDKKELDKGIEVELEHTNLSKIDNKVVKHIGTVIATKIA
jgi:hypothetical protein